MKMMRYVLGIDGGGSYTRAVIMNTNGTVCGIGLGGTSNYDDIGIEAARQNLSQTVEFARREANLPTESFDAAFLGLGGVSSQGDREIVREIASDLHLAPEKYIGVDHDIRIALAGGLSGRSGIVQIAGTGSSCYGRNAKGESWRSGGWGPLIADEGSGYWLGIQAMKAATRYSDGRSQPTILLDSVLDHLHLAHIDEIMYRIYAQEMSRSEIAELGPLVIKAAQEGDRVSLEIIEQGAQEMAECIFSVASHLGLTGECELALSGGVFKSGEVVVNPLSQAVWARLPQCRITFAELPPVLGACLLALKIIGIHLGEHNLQTLRETAPALF